MGDRGHETGGTIGWGLRGLGVAGITLSLVPVAHFPQPLRIIVFFSGLGDKWGGVMGVRGHETRGTIGWVLRGLGVAGITLSLVPVAHFSQPLRIILFFFAGLGDQWSGVIGVRSHETRGTIGWVLRGLGVAGIMLSLVPVAHFSQPLRIIVFFWQD